MERGSEGRKMGETKLREIALPRRSRPPRKKIFRISYFVEIGMRDGRFLSPPPRPCPRPFSCGRQENGQPSTFLSAAIPPPLLFLAALHLCPQIMELDQIFLWEMTGRQDRGNVYLWE